MQVEALVCMHGRRPNWPCKWREMRRDKGMAWGKGERTCMGLCKWETWGEKGHVWLDRGAGMGVDERTGQQSRGMGTSYLGLVGMLAKSQLDRGV